MMFLENSKMTGIIFEIVGALMLANAIYIIALMVHTVQLMEGGTRYILPVAISGAGNVIAAIVYILYADKVVRGRVGSKIHILSRYLIVVGTTTFLIMFCEVVADIMLVGHVPMMTIMLLMFVAICIILTTCGLIIASPKKRTSKKVLWYILILAFLAMAVYNLLPAANEWELVNSVAHLMIAVFMILLLYDDEVMTDMGVKK